MGKIIAVVSGKGGTGKTSFTANVGLALAALGKNTLCLDCDITLRNLDLALGLTDKALMDFSDVIAGRCSLSDAAADHPKYPGLHLLTAPLSPGGQLDVTDEQMRQLLDQVRQEYDYCLIDAPAGAGSGLPAGHRLRRLRGGHHHHRRLRPAGRPAHGDAAGQALHHRESVPGGGAGAEEAAPGPPQHHRRRHGRRRAAPAGVVPEDGDVPYALNRGIPCGISTITRPGPMKTSHGASPGTRCP